MHDCCRLHPWLGNRLIKRMRTQLKKVGSFLDMDDVLCFCSATSHLGEAEVEPDGTWRWTFIPKSLAVAYSLAASTWSNITCYAGMPFQSKAQVAVDFKPHGDRVCLVGEVSSSWKEQNRGELQAMQTTVGGPVNSSTPIDGKLLCGGLGNSCTCDPAFRSRQFQARA